MPARLRPRARYKPGTSMCASDPDSRSCRPASRRRCTVCLTNLATARPIQHRRESVPPRRDRLYSIYIVVTVSRNIESRWSCWIGTLGGIREARNTHNANSPPRWRAVVVREERVVLHAVRSTRSQHERQNAAEPQRGVQRAPLELLHGMPFRFLLTGPCI